MTNDEMAPDDVFTNLELITQGEDLAQPPGQWSCDMIVSTMQHTDLLLGLSVDRLAERHADGLSARLNPHQALALAGILSRWARATLQRHAAMLARADERSR